MTSRWIALGILLSACQPASPPVEPNDLGITEVTVEHSTVQAERLLTVHGLDRDGTAIATATLRTGMVLYGADVTPELHAGTELAISVQETNANFVSPDRVPHVIYERLQPAMATFVGIHTVARALDNEAGIRFAPPRTGASDELAFTNFPCDGSRFPTAKGGSSQCCQQASNTYHVNATNAVVNRATYAPAYPSIPTCRKSDGTTGCTGSACLYGPCGSAIVSVQGTNGHVFHPISNPNVCGWDTGGGVFSPEAYSSQSLYSGVTATCGCTGCFDDGTPQCAFSDDFNRTSGMGSAWNISVGSWTTDGASAVAAGPPPASEGSISLPFGTDHYAVSARLSTPAGTSYTGIYSRSTNWYSENIYVAQIDVANQNVGLARRNNFYWTFLTSAPASLSGGTFYTLKLVSTGSNPVHNEVWLDGVQKIVFDDWAANRLPTGAFGGIQTYHVNAAYDSFTMDSVQPLAVQPPPPMTGSPFIDDFNRTTGLNGNGTNWSVYRGAYTTDGTNATCSSTAPDGTFARVVPSLGTNNYSVSSHLSVPSGSLKSGIFGRSAEILELGKNMYSAQISTAGAVQLYRRTEYNWVLLGTYSTTITPGTFYDLKLVMTGTSPVHLEVWFQGVQRITYDDSSQYKLLTGGHGIMSYNTGVIHQDYRADAI